MKIFWLILLCTLLALVIVGTVNYLLQRRRQKLADRNGVVVYATVLSMTDAGGLMKHAQVKKISLRVQEPGDNIGREVTIRTRIPPGQKFTSGMKVAVVIDPRNPKRVYPATPESAKRAVMTGSRIERRQAKAHGFSRQQPPKPGYQPPQSTLRRR